VQDASVSCSAFEFLIGLYIWVGIQVQTNICNNIHHCSSAMLLPTGPFINNCVGRGNLRPFLLFLLWTIMAAAYVLLMCSVLVWREWDVVRESAMIHSSISQGSSSALSSDSSTGSSNMRSAEYAAGALVSPAALNAAALSSGSSSSVQITSAGQQPVADAAWSSARVVASGGMLLLLLQLAPGWLLATYYLAAASAALLLAVGILLASQLSYLGSGVTYIQHLKRSAGGAAGAASEDTTAVANIDSCSGHGQQVNGNDRPCIDVQQVGVKQHNAAGSAAAARGVDQARSNKQPQACKMLQRQIEQWQVLWVRVKEVLGVDSSSGGSGNSLSRAILVPRWQPVAAPGATTAVKKWS
jgi:hypothetical protein